MEERFGVGPVGVELDTIFTSESRGVAVRSFVSMGLLAMGVRVGAIEGDGWFEELTFSLKYPLFLH